MGKILKYGTEYQSFSIVIEPNWILIVDENNGFSGSKHGKQILFTYFFASHEVPKLLGQ